ncbi:hypothetical protein B0H16DRAFT_1456135 [Mycena metata]|uniref:CxC2-like cysteine cluster KDZ transposase-associated domain-containing protein n=1 Tax=Mycena metata TaxID=1033252 RepID=A0AAD7NHL6_9AGAR|nr:hypothetical protein B0H16DRAFT_1456135 [Mycena metata]
MSGKKRKKTTTYHFSATPAGPSTQSSATTAASSATKAVLHEKTSVSQSDGHARQHRALVEVPTTSFAPRVHPDVPRESAPIYDWYSSGDLGVDRQTTTAGTENAADHRCRNCLSGGELMCSKCIVAAHRYLLFHGIEYWTGGTFEHKMLKGMGLRIQLGHWHDIDRHCSVPSPSKGKDFVIIDIHGVHDVALDYCGCRLGGHPTVQLLRAQLWPATSTNPQTAVTFAVLRQYHLMSFKSKCSALECYQSLARQTDNVQYKRARKTKKEKQAADLESQERAREHARQSGSKRPKALKNRYREFLRITRQWQHVRMLKRAARGHDPKGIANTQPGECALLCPACPQPGKNMAPDWESTPEDHRFIHALFVAMDANFRLKRKDDPGLGNGWVFFCEVKAYMEHVKNNWNQKQDRSHCVAHDAVDKPDREARGTASSGIGAADCARHNMKRPLSVGDLQLGERYLDMDYMFFRSIAGSPLVQFFVSYDIACQWHIHVWDRLCQYQDGTITIDGFGKFVTFLVPKFHLPAHIEECNLKFSFNLTRFVGQTDGEAPQRGWANANPLARSTKEMGPGSRRDTLDDHFNDAKHKKIIALGYMLRKKVENAVAEMVRTRQALQDLEGSLDAEAVEQWEAMARAWEEDSANPNPFAMLRKDRHVAQVRAELAAEAAEREAAGKEDVGAVRGDMHITELIAMGLQLEDQQRILGFDVAATGLHPTDGQRRAMIECSSKLRRKIVAWIDLQVKFFPGLLNVQAMEDAERAWLAETQPVPGISVSDMKLWMPSAVAAVPRSVVQDVPVKDEVYQHEYRLRIGQAEEGLHKVRRLLLLKDEHSRGVRANMRSQDKIEALNDQTQRSASQYRAARQSLVSLGRVLKCNEWQRTLLELKPDDVRGLPQATFHDPERKKKKRRAVQIEWAKTRARSHRWKEEVDLLEEEMARVQRFFAWRAAHWREQVGRRELPEGQQLEGETAYALRQAAVQEELGDSVAEEWGSLAELIRRGRAGELEENEMVAGTEGETGGDDEDSDEDDEGEDTEGEEDDPVPALPRREIKTTYVDEILVMEG